MTTPIVFTPNRSPMSRPTRSSPCGDDARSQGQGESQDDGGRQHDDNGGWKNDNETNRPLISATPAMARRATAS